MSDILSIDTKNWDENFLNQVLPKNVVQNILAIDLRQHTTTKDTIFWPHSSKGTLTVKSVYAHLIRDKAIQNGHPPLPPPNPIWKRIWSLDVLPRIRVFVWKCYSGILPVSSKIGRWVTTVDKTCIMCGFPSETDAHTLFRCPFSHAVWFGIHCRVDTNTANVQEWIESWITNTQPSLFSGVQWNQLYALTSWYIWKARCLKCFQQQQQTPAVTIHQIENHFQLRKTNPSELSFNGTPTLAQLDQIQIMIQVPKLTMKCFSSWHVHPHTAIVINVLTDERGKTKGRWACLCAVSSLQQSAAVGVIEAMKWHQHHNLRICNIEMDDSKLMKILKTKWSLPQQATHVALFEHNVELFSYFRKLNCNSLRQDWKTTIQSMAKDYAPSTGDGGAYFSMFDCNMYVPNNASHSFLGS
ncbi:uncharacterized protein LOC113360523 [Papaver somniferum]|uniref:uncharacterized protein LOC113360523 n=1 Tax=Papaver somniferum TaxID=3469 RepID=UPI000E70355A|nr:uncharacterized protein LOC113360523 [Papaver somniferum]